MQFLVPAPGLGGHHRSNSSTGHRAPTPIVINNDNNVHWEEERRPRSSHGRHYYDHEDYLVERIQQRLERSRSRSRLRRRPHTPDSLEEKVEEKAEVKERLHRLEELERQAAEEEQEKRVKEQLLLKQAKEKEAADKKKKEEDDFKRRAFEEFERKELEKKAAAERKKKDEEEFKKRAVEEWEKKEQEKKDKAKKEEEDRKKDEEEAIRKTLRANGYSEADIDKIIKRSKDGGKGKEKEHHHHGASTALTPARPTYIKVAVKHLDPETLNEYRLPWEYDDVSLALVTMSDFFLANVQQRDTNYIIIKQWIPEHDQDILFEHTRQLRERRLLIETSTSLKKERDQLYIVKKKKKVPVRNYFLT